MFCRNNSFVTWVKVILKGSLFLGQRNSDKEKGLKMKKWLLVLIGPAVGVLSWFLCKTFLIPEPLNLTHLTGSSGTKEIVSAIYNVGFSINTSIYTAMVIEVGILVTILGSLLIAILFVTSKKSRQT